MVCFYNEGKSSAAFIGEGFRLRFSVSAQSPAERLTVGSSALIEPMEKEKIPRQILFTSANIPTVRTPL